jgi:hypothetical protein
MKEKEMNQEQVIQIGDDGDPGTRDIGTIQLLAGGLVTT